MSAGPGHLNSLIDIALQAQARGERVVVATVVRSSLPDAFPPATRLMLEESGRTTGGICPDLDLELVQLARERLEAQRAGIRSYKILGSHLQDVGVQGGDIDVYFEILGRQPRLVVVGAGHIAQPLATFAEVLDFHVTVLDDRPTYANRERFPRADEIIVGGYAESLASLNLDTGTYIVLVTRGHVHDMLCLEHVVGLPVAYVGMIGSRRRVRTVMQNLRDRGCDTAALSRVHAPVGLDIGAHTPAEIALAIMAEIVNLRRGGRAPSLALGERLHV